MELKIPPLLQVLLFGLGMLVVERLFPSLTFSIPSNIPVGILAISIGAILAIIGVVEFRKAKTTVDPRDPQKSEKLVTNGIYAISRNPMYLGFLVILLGWFIILENIAGLLFLPAFVLFLNYFQIKPEERFLLQKFGSDYSEYCRKVRRWI